MNTLTSRWNDWKIMAAGIKHWLMVYLSILCIGMVVIIIGFIGLVTGMEDRLFGNCRRK